MHNNYMPRLTQLPNGDLWRGVPPADAEQREDNVEAPAAGSSDEAMEQIVKSARGSKTLTCIWCGQQYGRHQYNEMYAHVEKLHRKSSAPADSSDKLAAALQLAKDELLTAQRNDEGAGE